MSIVNVSMYGGKSIFGGRETKAVAVVSSCEFADDCPALKEGRCAAYNPRMYSCVNLKTVSHEGYTSRAQKYHAFMNKWKNHEKYNSINDNLKRFEYIGNNLVRIELPHIDISRAIDGERGYSAMSAKDVGYIDKKGFGVEQLTNLMASYSVPLMGGRLDSIEEKEELLLDIKAVDQELCDEFTSNSGIEINYVGKKAYVKTLKSGIELKDGWIWDGEKLFKSGRSYTQCDAIEGFAYGTNISFTPDDDSTVIVKDNEWITENTKFKSN